MAFNLMKPILLPHEPGTLERYANFESRFVAPRHVDVWLPPGYGQDQKARYPVLYMHDGQNIFDPETSYTKIDWGVDESVSRLIEEDQHYATIIVGLWNTPQRYEEYMPQKPFLGMKNSAALRKHGELLSDNYLKFIVQEVKPFIDSNYRTLPDQPHTAIMGSSMGGLISAYAVCEYPGVFSAAGCVSTHWPADNGIVLSYLEKALPDPQTHRFYFDYGTEGTDANYEAYQQRADTMLSAAGYEPGKNWMTQRFPGADHSELAWRTRVKVPLRFLLHD